MSEESGNNTVKLTIDGREITAEDGATVLEVARQFENLGFKMAIIPRKHSQLDNIKMEIVGVDDVKEAVRIAVGNEK